MANIRAKGSGPISLRGTDETNGIAEQFGGTKPDGVSEYYRGKDYGASAGGVVVPDTTGNATITKSGAQAFSNYYGTQKSSPLAPGGPGLSTPDEIDHAFGEAAGGAAQTPTDTLNKALACFSLSDPVGSYSNSKMSRDGIQFSSGKNMYGRESLGYSVTLHSAEITTLLKDAGIYPKYKPNAADTLKFSAGLSYDTKDMSSKHDPRNHTEVYLAAHCSFQSASFRNHPEVRGGGFSTNLKPGLDNHIYKLTWTNPVFQGNYPATGPSHNGTTMVGYFQADMKARSVILHKPAQGEVMSLTNPPPSSITRQVAVFGQIEQGYPRGTATVHPKICVLPYNAETKGAVIAEYGGWDPWAQKGYQHFPASPLKAAPYVPPLPQPKPPKDVIILRFTNVTKPLTFGGASGHVSATIQATMNGAARVGLTVYIMGKWIGAPGGSWAGGAKLVAVGGGGTTNASGNFSINLEIPAKPAGAAEFWVGCTYITSVGGNVAGTPDSRRVIP